MLTAIITFSTILIFLLSVFFFKRSTKRYFEEIRLKKRCFDEILESTNRPINNLSEESQTFARDVCAIKQQGKHDFVSFKDERMEIMRHPSQIVNEFSVSSFSSVPAILTVIGILGTFVGITIGLSGLGSDTQILIQQAMKLIGGLGTAFWTSIVGMGSSFLFMLFMSWYVSKAKEAKNTFIKEIQPYCTVVTSNDLLHQLVLGQRQAADDSDNLSNLVNVLTRIADKPAGVTAQEFEAISNQHLNTLRSTLAGVETVLVKSLSKLKVDEVVFSKTISAQFQAVLDESLACPIRTLDGINQESKQSNQALFSIVGLLESASKNHSPALTKDELESILSKAVTMPIDKTTNEVTNLLNSVDGKMSMFASNMLTEDKLGSALAKPALDIAQIAKFVSSLMHKNPLTAETLHSALSELVTTPIQQIQKDMSANAHNALGAIDEVTQSVNTLAKARANEFNELIDKMGMEILSPIVNELSETNKVVASFAEISNELNQSISKTVEQMAKATATVEKFELHTLKKLNDFAHSMDESLNNFAINSTAALNSITKEISGIVELGNASIAEQTKSFSKMVTDSELIYKQQSQTLIDVGKNSAALMTSAKQELERGLGDIDSKVINMSLVIQEELESFRAVYQENLSDYFNQQNEILDKSLNAQRDGLNEVVANFKHVFEDEYKKRNSLITDLNTHHKQMIDVIDRIQSMAKALGLENTSWVDTLQQQSQTVSRQMAQLGLAFSSASEEFKALTSQMRPEMDDYFKRANKSVNEYFSSFDATSSRIYSRLDSAVDLMMTVIQEAKHEKDNILKLKVKEKAS